MLRVNQLSSFGAGFRQPLTTISFIASANSNTANITLPGTIEPGDLLLLFQAATTNTTLPTAVTPSGWTNLVNQSGITGTDADRVMVDYRISDGSEDGSSITGMDGGISDRKIVLQFRGDQLIRDVTLQDLAAQFTSGNPAAQTVNASGGIVPLIVFGNWYSANAIDPRTFSPAADGEIQVTGSNIFFVKYKIYNSSPADHTVDMDDEGSVNDLFSFYLQLS